MTPAAARLRQLRLRLPGLDRLAIGVSGLCVVHCVATSVLLVAVSTAGGLLFDPLVHEVGLMLAILLGALGLGHGIARHGRLLPVCLGSLGLGVMAGAMNLPHDGSEAEALWTIAGVGLLALGHELNRRAGHLAAPPRAA